MKNATTMTVSRRAERARARSVLLTQFALEAAAAALAVGRHGEAEHHLRDARTTLAKYQIPTKL